MEKAMEIFKALSEIAKDEIFNSDNVVRKNNKMAIELKVKGNSAFQANNWTLALGFYNQALMMTPTENVKDFAILLANRSAVLFHLKEYKLAIKDIKMAVLNYPKDKKYKIKERLAKCYLSIDDFHNSLNAFKQLIRCLNESSLTNEKRKKSVKDAKIMIKNVQDKLELVNKTSSTPSTQLSMKKYADDDMSTKLNDSVGFDYKASKGHYAKANNDIKVGESILIEKPHCTVLFEKYSKTHCHHCFLRTITPTVCPNCTYVIFCSNECKDLALSSYHNIECKYLPFIWDSGLSFNCQMALKIICQKPLQYFINMKDQLNDKLKFGDTLRLPPDDYRTVYTLVRHENKCSLIDLERYSVTAECLTYFLRKGNYFSSINANDKQLNELNSFIERLIFRNLQLIKYNSHAVNEIEYFDGEERQLINSLGIGIYPTFARFNHSCNPSIIRYFKGTSVYVHAITNIKQGQVLLTIMVRFMLQSHMTNDKKNLKNLDSIACVNHARNYGQYIQIWMKQKFHSKKQERYTKLEEILHSGDVGCAGGKQNCKNILMISIDVNHDVEFDYMVKCNKCNRNTNILKCLRDIQEMVRLKEKAKQFFERGENQKAAEINCEIITLLDDVTGLPFIEYLNAQQSYRECLFLNGNKNVHIKK